MVELFTELSDAEKSEIINILHDALNEMHIKGLTHDKIVRNLAKLSLSFDSDIKNEYCDMLINTLLLGGQNE